MSEVLAGGAGVGGGVCGGVCVWAGWRRRFLRFFFFFGLTGASAGRTVKGEIPPDGPCVAVVPGVVPPLLPPADGTGATPPVAADAEPAPTENATTRTTSAKAERSRCAPCMGPGIG